MTVSRATVHSVELSKDSYRERTRPLRAAEAPTDAVRPAVAALLAVIPNEKIVQR